MYKQVAKMTPVARLYERELLAEGTLTEEELADNKRTIKGHLEEAYAKSKTLEYRAEDWSTEEWEKIKLVDWAE